YLSINNKNDRVLLKQIINEILPNNDLTWENNIATLIVEDNDSFQFKLEKILTTFIQDFNEQVSILIVPFFNNIFIKYLSYINNESCTIFDVFLKNINDEKVKKDAKTILNSINQKDLDTLKAFLKCNGNSSIAANELYIHRNTFNYRVNHLIQIEKVEIRDLNTLMFFNLLISICS
ncbi:MAG: helix-turn-helix domain-containing protein, partial [Erysipelotrichaceae bacterium]|nr:helix-turn-helix domain-containing protein [Erysipelotrichaceae bacterium]